MQNISKLQYIAGLSFLSMVFLIAGHIVQVGFKSFFAVSNWLTPQYFLNYQEFGFIKRGFIGSVINIFTDNPTSLSIFIISCLVSVLTTVIFWSFIVNSSYHALNYKSRNIFFMLVALSPAIFWQFGYDLGRYDQINFSILIISLLLIEKDKLFFSSVLCALALLIHEVFLFMFMPVIFFIVLDKYKDDTITMLIKKLLFFLSLPVVTMLFITLYGKFEPGIDILTDNLKETNAASVIALMEGPFSPLEVWVRSASDNFTHTLKHFSVDQVYRTKGFINSLFIGLFYLAFWVIFYYKLHKDNKIHFNLLSFAPFMSFPLYFIGTDYARWFSIIILNMCIVFLFKLRKPIVNNVQISYNVITGFLVLSTILGPIGVLITWPALITICFYIFNFINLT